MREHNNISIIRCHIYLTFFKSKVSSEFKHFVFCCVFGIEKINNSFWNLFNNYNFDTDVKVKETKPNQLTGKHKDQWVPKFKLKVVFSCVWCNDAVDSVLFWIFTRSNDELHPDCRLKLRSGYCWHWIFVEHNWNSNSYWIVSATRTKLKFINDRSDGKQKGSAKFTPKNRWSCTKNGFESTKYAMRLPSRRHGFGFDRNIDEHWMRSTFYICIFIDGR